MEQTLPEWHVQCLLTASPETTAIYLTTELQASCASISGQKGQSKHMGKLNVLQ